MEDPRCGMCLSLFSIGTAAAVLELHGVDCAGSCAHFQEYDIEVSEKDQAAAAAASGISMKTVDAGTSRASVLREGDADLGKVVENRLLTSPNAPAK